MKLLMSTEPAGAFTAPESEKAGASGKKLSPLGWILVAGAIVRLILWLWFQDLPPRIHDEKDYNQIAINLVEHGEFGFRPGELTSIRPPLYPFLMAGVYQLFGLENFQAVRLVQLALSLVTVVVVYGLGVTLFSRRVGTWAAGITCFYPSLLGANYLLLTETLFTLLLCTFCLVLVRAMKRDSVWLLALAGVTLGLAALTRSIVWLFPPVLGVFLLMAWKGNPLHRIGAVAVFVFAFATILAPWTVRNTRLQETFVTVDVMGGRNFMTGNYQHTPLYRSWATIGISGENSWAHELHTSYPREEWETQGKLDKLAMRHTVKYVLANPGLTFQRAIIKFFDFWGLERELLAGASEGFFGPLSQTAIIALTLTIFSTYAVSLLLGIQGFILTPSADWRGHWFLLLVIAFICGMHTLVFGHSRYHLPLMPLIFLYSATAVLHLSSIWGCRNRWQFWVACGACGVIVAGWLWLFIAVDLQIFLDKMGSFG